MADPHDPDHTVDEVPPRPLDAALAAAFGPDSGPPLSSAASVVRALGADPVQLRTPASEPEEPVVKPHSDAVPDQLPAGLRIHGEIARGGMGAVLKGRDNDLGRDVAVKVLLETHRGRTELVQRFVEEAQIAGQLQHPGVVPVYEMGQLSDQRPYFTMKLVKGQTLAKILAARKDPSEDRPRFLGIFLQVCQTLAYAHARGVIHRDLKPSNVMVGAFGEVQVMDWGLAKVLKQGGVADEKPPAPEEATVIRTARSGSATTGQPGSQTRAGQVMGTPPYMAPEQARGEVEGLDERCDVFGLGAILCQILTGLPAYAGRDAEALFGMASRAELADAFARLDNCGADVELIALARRCLCADRTGRSRDAGALATELSAYLESVEVRLRRAQLERAAAEARAVEERKRRRVQIALAASVLLLVIGGGGGAWWAQQERQARVAEKAGQQREADSAVARAMGDARLLLEQAKAEPLGDSARFREARAAARKAQELARTGAASEKMEQDASDLAELLEAEQVAAERDRALLATLLEVRGPREGPKYKKDEKGFMMKLAEPSADEQFAAAFRAWGLDVDAVTTAEATTRLKGRPSAVVMEVIAALDEWAGERRQSDPPGQLQPLAQLVAALDDPETKRAELRALLARNNLPAERTAEALLALSAALRPVPVPFVVVVEGDRARLRQLAEQTDAAKEPVLGVLALAWALHAGGDDALAERLLRTAVIARPREVVLHTQLGQLLWEQRPPRWGEAVECFAAARALRPELGVALAESLVNCGRKDEGFALYERLAAERKDNPWIHYQLGRALWEGGRNKEAEAAFREAIRLKPDDPKAHNALGVALFPQARFGEAGAAYREAIRLEPDSPETYNNLGVVLFLQGKFKEGEAALREALRLKPDYPGARSNLSGLLVIQGGSDKEAEARYQEAIRLQPDNADAHKYLGAILCDVHHCYKEAEEEFRTSLRLKADDAEAHYNLGNALVHQGRFQEAEATYRKATHLKPDYAEAHGNHGATLIEQGRHKEAEAALREAIRLKPDYPEAHKNLGAALFYQDRHKEAEAAFREAIRLQPSDPEKHYLLGAALAEQDRHKEAEAAFREAIRFKPAYPEAHSKLGNALNVQGRSKEAEVAYREVIRLQPDDSAAHGNLGFTLVAQGLYKEAAAAYREAIRLQPDDPDLHYDLGCVLGEQGRYKEAGAAYREALRLRPDYPQAHCNLGHTMRNQGRFAEALEELRRGHALGSKAPGWGYPSADWVRECERLVELDGRLPAILRGEQKPASAAELPVFARLCAIKKLNTASARLYADAFAADPKLADDLDRAYRYSAACAAARAAAGQGEDAKRLPDKAVIMLRGQALRWLRADLVLRIRMAERDDDAAKQTVRAAIQHWQGDADLASVRDPAALEKLADDERAAWRALWADVDGLLRKVAEKPK
jgi:serine/threonine-protein kinase